MIPVTAVLITREKQWPCGLPTTPAEIMLETECPNVFRRFEIAAEARTQNVFVQDDDVTLDVEELWKHYDGRITNVMPIQFQRMYAGTGVTLIGWGSFFPRSMARTFVAQQKFWRNKFGNEIFETEADRFFTFSHRPFNNIHMPFEQVRRPGCMSDRPEHYRVRDMIFKTLKEMA